MFFSEVLEAKPDAVFGMAGAFKADVRPNKVNLMVGIYHDKDLNTKLIPAVKKAKEGVLEEDLMANYLPMDGLASFCEKIGALVFGRHWEANRERIFSAQTPGGTGALRVGGEFLVQEVTQNIYLSDPTWPNHFSIFERAGCRVETYPYYNREKHGFDLAAMCAFLEKAPEKSAVVLHAACHNPTGCDPTLEEWREISKLMRKKNLLPFFDFAYQGFGRGIEKDREVIELFLEEGHEMLISYSCSKNFSLYCQRVGALFVVSENGAVKTRVGSQVKRIIRALYSNPPAHGAKIVDFLLGSPSLKREWERELEEMKNHLIQTREKFVEMLLSKTKHFDFLKNHKGMFSFLDLEKAQVQKMIDEFAVYTVGGRINVAGLTKNNMEYVVESLLAVCE